MSDATAQIDQHLQLITNTPVNDEATAQQALAYTLSAVGSINQHLAVAEQPRTALLSPVDDIVKKLEEWINELYRNLVF
jgi:hypothetical protein